MRPESSFSIVIPVYQNELNLPGTFTQLLTLKERLPVSRVEVIFVDDGSRDQSFNQLVEFQKNHPHWVKIIKFTRNFGQVSATFAGIREASGEVVGVISADLQDPPELFIEMYNCWKDGNKLVIAERESRKDGAAGGLMSKFTFALIRKFALKDYPKGGFDFCLLDRDIIHVLNSFTEKNTHIFPLIFSFGFPYKIITYKRVRRELGKSQWTLAKRFKLFLDTFIAFSYAPIRTISLMGLIVSLFSFLYGIFIVVSYFLIGSRYPGWATLAVLSSFLSGMILLTLGIIGEYLWRILDEVRPRPAYIIEKKFDGDPTKSR